MSNVGRVPSGKANVIYLSIFCLVFSASFFSAAFRSASFSYLAFAIVAYTSLIKSCVRPTRMSILPNVRAHFFDSLSTLRYKLILFGFTYCRLYHILPSSVSAFACESFCRIFMFLILSSGVVMLNLSDLITPTCLSSESTRLSILGYLCNFWI